MTSTHLDPFDNIPSILNIRKKLKNQKVCVYMCSIYDKYMNRRNHNKLLMMVVNFIEEGTISYWW